MSMKNAPQSYFTDFSRVGSVGTLAAVFSMHGNVFLLCRSGVRWTSPSLFFPLVWGFCFPCELMRTVSPRLIARQPAGPRGGDLEDTSKQTSLVCLSIFKHPVVLGTVLPLNRWRNGLQLFQHPVLGHNPRVAEAGLRLGQSDPTSRGHPLCSASTWPREWARWRSSLGLCAGGEAEPNASSMVLFVKRRWHRPFESYPRTLHVPQDHPSCLTCFWVPDPSICLCFPEVELPLKKDGFTSESTTLEALLRGEGVEKKVDAREEESIQEIQVPCTCQGSP